jgi:hypothetical protein
MMTASIRGLSDGIGDCNETAVFCLNRFFLNIDSGPEFADARAPATTRFRRWVNLPM